MDRGGRSALDVNALDAKYRCNTPVTVVSDEMRATVVEAGGRTLHTGKKASTAACFVRLPGALVAFAAQAPFEVLDQRFRFPQVRCVKAFCELLVDRLHQL